MNNLTRGGIFLFIIITLILCGPVNTDNVKATTLRYPVTGLFGKSGGSRKQAKVKEPRSVQKARKKQEANEKRMKKEYEEYVKDSRKRAYDIQSPEVQARMKKNKKDISARDKSRKKSDRQRTKQGGKKYK